MVQRARERFGSHAFMDFRTFDLEQPPEQQGLGGQRFDLIVAANVIHATADLRQTLGRLRDLLVPGGTLLMLEVAGFEGGAVASTKSPARARVFSAAAHAIAASTDRAEARKSIRLRG